MPRYFYRHSHNLYGTHVWSSSHTIYGYLDLLGSYLTKEEGRSDQPKCVFLKHRLVRLWSNILLATSSSLSQSGALPTYLGYYISELGDHLGAHLVRCFHGELA